MELGRTYLLVLWAIALEALVAFAKFAVRLIGLVCLHPVALVCFVASDNAASRRSQNPVMSSNMPSDATAGRTASLIPPSRISLPRFLWPQAVGDRNVAADHSCVGR